MIRTGGGTSAPSGYVIEGGSAAGAGRLESRTLGEVCRSLSGRAPSEGAIGRRGTPWRARVHPVSRASWRRRRTEECGSSADLLPLSLLPLALASPLPSLPKVSHCSLLSPAAPAPPAIHARLRGPFCGAGPAPITSLADVDLHPLRPRNRASLAPCFTCGRCLTTAGSKPTSVR